MQHREAFADAANGQKEIGGLRAFRVNFVGFGFDEETFVERFPAIEFTGEDARDFAIGLRLRQHGVEAGEVALRTGFGCGHGRLSIVPVCTLHRICLCTLHRLCINFFGESIFQPPTNFIAR